MTMRFLIGTLFGILLGGAAGFGLQTYLEHKLVPQSGPTPTEMRLVYSEPLPQAAATWLLPKDFEISKVFSDVKALVCVLEPDSVIAHLSDAKGNQRVFDYRFSTDGVPVEGNNLSILRQVWEAPNAYRPISACAFDPGVLFVFRRGHDSVKIIVCFKCKDMLSVFNDQEKERAGAGITEYAVHPLKAVLHQLFPENSNFLQNAPPRK